LLDDIALSRRHVVLEHVEVLARLALALLLVDTDVIISSPSADLNRFFKISDELTEKRGTRRRSRAAVKDFEGLVNFGDPEARRDFRRRQFVMEREPPQLGAEARIQSDLLPVRLDALP
jgi:hypothetical protein